MAQPKPVDFTVNFNIGRDVTNIPNDKGAIIQRVGSTLSAIHFPEGQKKIVWEFPIIFANTDLLLFDTGILYLENGTVIERWYRLGEEHRYVFDKFESFMKEDQHWQPLLQSVSK